MEGFERTCSSWGSSWCSSGSCRNTGREVESCSCPGSSFFRLGSKEEEEEEGSGVVSRVRKKLLVQFWTDSGFLDAIYDVDHHWKETLGILIILGMILLIGPALMPEVDWRTNINIKDASELRLSQKSFSQSMFYKITHFLTNKTLKI